LGEEQEFLRKYVESKIRERAELHERLADAYHDLAEGKVEEAKRKLRKILGELDTA
jgi:predicted RNA-binding protein